MRIQFFSTSCLLFLFMYASGQEIDFHGFSNATQAEREMKECNFDKDANALVLLNEAVSNFDDEYHLITDHRVRIKIFSNKGLDYGNVKIFYQRKDDFESISEIEGLTINTGPGGELIQNWLDKKSIYNQKVNDRWSKISLAFPAVKAGSIIEYKYRSVMKHYGGLDDWDFQEEIPVLTSRYKLYVVPNAEFAYAVNKRPDLPITITPNSKEGSIYFEMNNIPALIDEPYMEARKDYLQKAVFQLSGYQDRYAQQKKYMNSWDDVIKELMSDENFGSQLNKRLSGSSQIIGLLDTMSAVRKMQFIHNYVRKNMVWDNIYSKYSMEGVKSTWQKRHGTSGEINLLLVNLLKDAGLETYPMLVSERFNGKVKTDYPFIDQFNSVFAYVVIEGKKYYLDATDRFTPVYIIPYSLLNTTALIVDKKKGGLITISNDALQFDDDIHTEIDVKNDGSFSGNVKIESKDYAKVMRTSNYKEDKDDYMKDYFHKDGGAISVNDFDIAFIESDSMPLEQHCKFSSNAAATDGYAYIPLDLFSGIQKNPFLASERFSNINFGFKRSIRIFNTISLPANYIIDVLPANQKIVNEAKDISISRQVSYDKENNRVSCALVIEFKNAVYDAGMYPVLQKFYKKMFELLKEPLLLKKK